VRRVGPVHSTNRSLPGGGVLTTLKEAVAYLAKTFPNAEQEMPEVLAAAEALTNAERGRQSRRTGRQFPN
jgi:hypothetical protein